MSRVTFKQNGLDMRRLGQLLLAEFSQTLARFGCEFPLFEDNPDMTQLRRQAGREHMHERQRRPKLPGEFRRPGQCLTGRL
jgi:hypothetical protein